MVKLHDDIQNFKRVEGKSIHENWLRFQKLVLICPSHKLPGDLILQYFYQSFGSVMKGVADQLDRGGIILQ